MANLLVWALIAKGVQAKGNVRRSSSYTRSGYGKMEHAYGIIAEDEKILKFFKDIISKGKELIDKENDPMVEEIITLNNKAREELPRVYEKIEKLKELGVEISSDGIDYLDGGYVPVKDYDVRCSRGERGAINLRRVILPVLFNGTKISPYYIYNFVEGKSEFPQLDKACTPEQKEAILEYFKEYKRYMNENRKFSSKHDERLEKIKEYKYSRDEDKSIWGKALEALKEEGKVDDSTVEYVDKKLKHMTKNVWEYRDGMTEYKFESKVLKETYVVKEFVKGIEQRKIARDIAKKEARKQKLENRSSLLDKTRDLMDKFASKSKDGVKKDGEER